MGWEASPSDSCSIRARIVDQAYDGPSSGLADVPCDGLGFCTPQAQSFVASIPLDAVTWLGFGLVATGAASYDPAARLRPS